MKFRNTKNLPIKKLKTLRADIVMLNFFIEQLINKVVTSMENKLTKAESY